MMAWKLKNLSLDSQDPADNFGYDKTSKSKMPNSDVFYDHLLYLHMFVIGRNFNMCVFKLEPVLKKFWIS